MTGWLVRRVVHALRAEGVLSAPAAFRAIEATSLRRGEALRDVISGLVTAPGEGETREAVVDPKYFSPLSADESRRYAGTLRSLLRALDGEIVSTALVGESESDLLGPVGQEVDRVREFLDGRVVMPAQPSDLRCRALAILDGFADELEARAGHSSPSVGACGSESRGAFEPIVGDPPGVSSFPVPGATPDEVVP